MTRPPWPQRSRRWPTGPVTISAGWLLTLCLFVQSAVFDGDVRFVLRTASVVMLLWTALCHVADIADAHRDEQIRKERQRCD